MRIVHADYKSPKEAYPKQRSESQTLAHLIALFGKRRQAKNAFKTS